MTSTMTRSYHHGDLRNSILEAARRIIAEHGPDGFTMAKAAREAGVSSGAPYKHFADRQALMHALARQGRDALQVRMLEAMAGIHDPREAFRQTGIAYVQFAVEEPGWFRVMSMPEYLDYDSEEPDVQDFWQPLSQFVTSVPADERLPEHPLLAQLAARVLIHGLASFMVQGSFGPLGIDQDRARQLADAMTRSLGMLAMPPPDSHS